MVTAVKKTPFQRNRLIRDAIGRATYDAMKADSTIHLFGEGAEVKQHYDAPYILEEFGQRVTTTPIAEDGTLNFAVGTALAGVTPVVDVIAADFLYRCADAICNTAAKLNAVRQARHTLVIRAEYLVGGPTTGQRPEAMFAHVPGLTVHVPSTPADAYGLLRTALQTPGVHLIFEDRMVADGGYFQHEDFYSPTVPFGRLSWRVRHPGADVAVLTYGVLRQQVEALVVRENLRVNLFDLRSIQPLDTSGIMDAVKRTGKLLIVEPDVTRFGVGAEIAALVAEQAPGTRVKRLGAPAVIIPSAIPLHRRMLPSDEEVLDAIGSLA